MSWGFLISFGVALAVYLLIVGIVALIKKHKKKKKDKTDSIVNTNHSDK